MQKKKTPLPSRRQCSAILYHSLTEKECHESGAHSKHDQRKCGRVALREHDPAVKPTIRSCFKGRAGHPTLSHDCLQGSHGNFMMIGRASRLSTPTQRTVPRPREDLRALPHCLTLGSPHPDPGIVRCRAVPLSKHLPGTFASLCPYSYCSAERFGPAVGLPKVGPCSLSPHPPSAACNPSTMASRVASSSATTVMWPSLRPGRGVLP